MHPRPYPIPSAIPLAPLIALVAFAGAVIVPAFAQDGGEKEPEQTHVSPFTEPFQHTDDPVFAVAFPKGKKGEALRERWLRVDLAARGEAQIANIQAALDAELAKDPQDEMRVTELRGRLAEVQRFYARTKLLLEVQGKPDEFVRIEASPLLDRNVPINKLERRNWFETKYSGVKILKDEDTTTKAQRKKGQQAWTIMLTGTPEGESSPKYIRIEDKFIPSKDDTKLYHLTWMHVMPASAIAKETIQEDELLAQTLIVP